MEELIAASLIVMVENLSDNVNNAKLREVFFPLHAKRCRVAYIEKEHMGFAAIEFQTEEEATNALEIVNGTIIGNNAVTCRLGNTPDAKWFVRSKKKKPKQKKDPLDVNAFQYETLFNSIIGVQASTFCIIDFESVVCMTGGHFLPCEIGIVVHNMVEGEKRHYHKFIDPGPLPLGYTAQALWTTKHIHGIPHENFELAANDYKKIWQDIIDVVQGNTILYAKGKAMEEYCIQWLAEKAGETNPFVVREMSQVLKGIHFLLGKPFTNLSIENLFKDAMTSYYGGKCGYHTDLEINIAPHCALGDVRAIASSVKYIIDYYTAPPQGKEDEWWSTPSSNTNNVSWNDNDNTWGNSLDNRSDGGWGASKGGWGSGNSECWDVASANSANAGWGAENGIGEHTNNSTKTWGGSVDNNNNNINYNFNYQEATATSPNIIKDDPNDSGSDGVYSDNEVF